MSRVRLSGHVPHELPGNAQIRLTLRVILPTEVVPKRCTLTTLTNFGKGALDGRQRKQ